jgi:glycosyltransferase involved in cell wall biosynthesis
LLARERPLCVLSYTVKPNAYVSLAGRALGIPVIVNIAGLGSVFVTHTWLTALVGTLYKIAFYGSHCVFFQNRDDLEYFVGNGIVSASAARVLPGSGVDIDRFLPSLPTSAGDGRFRFLLLGRLLWEKGVGDYMDAARSLKLEHPEAEFHLMGFVEVDSPSAISRRQIDKWKAEGIVIFHEASDDVIPWIANADCVILPSYYREGTPRALLEAASMGKPLITTDMPGCRDTVEDGKTGYLVRPRDVGDLIEKMENMLRLPAEDRRKMGLRGRAKMIREFDERIVLGKYLEVIREIQSREV